jgi:hypothetical protein
LEEAKPGDVKGGWSDEFLPQLIRLAARQHFEWHGAQSGRDVEHWLQAEREIKLQLKHHDIELREHHSIFK